MVQLYQIELPRGSTVMSPYAPGFAPVAGREELRSAMHNRFYDNVSRPGHYGFLRHDVVTADMVPLGASRRARGIRGLGDICDDEGAALGVGIAASVMRLGGAALSASGAATTSGTGADATKSGGDTGRARAGDVFGGAGNALVDAWTAACLSSTRGSSTGATPSESMDSTLARARAEWTASAAADRAAASDLELERERAARAEERAAQNRNLLIAAAVGIVVIGGVVYFVGGRRR